MRYRSQGLLPRVGTFLVPILLGQLLFLPVARCQNKGRRVEIDVTVRDSGGAILSVPASVKLFWNGTPCDQGATSNGRISFSIAKLGKFTAVAEAQGYKPGQNDVNAAEPVAVQLEVNLQRDPSSNPPPATPEPILAPKAKEALDKGMQALRQENLSEAEKDLDQSLKLAPNHPQVLYVQGLLDLKKHDWTKAQSDLEKVVQMEPNSALVLAALGMALCNQKKYAEAIAPLEKSVELDPASGWERHWSLAESYYHNQRFEEALKASQQAEAESNDAVPQVDLLVAKSLTAVGRYEESAKVLRELVKNHGADAEGATARRFLERLTADGKIQPQ
jgi:Tfp pilus assembly protein PilF